MVPTSATAEVFYEAYCVTPIITAQNNLVHGAYRLMWVYVHGFVLCQSD